MAGRWWQQRWVWVSIAIGVLIIALIVWRIVASSAGGKAAEAGPVPVTTAPVRQGTFVVKASAPGIVTPINSVLVRSQVDGRLTSVAFKEGQMVERGAVLATVDPQPFQADLTVATGRLASDTALLDNAQDTLTRYQALLAQHSIERQRVADQQAQVRQYAAAVKVDQSRVETARLQLSYTKITAPISGMAGLRNVDPDNLVGPSDAHGIVRITQLQPTTVVFALPAAVLPDALRALHAHAPVPVAAYGQGGATKLDMGHLLAVNNEIDPATGTIKLKAEFANKAEALFPNQGVTVRMPVQTLHDALLVPVAAIQQGANGSFVYVVNGQSKATVAPVTTGPRDAATAVITKGVTAGERVVVEGADQLRDGARVALPAAASTRGKGGGR